MGNRLKIKRILQYSGDCATAASAALANFYDKDITYDSVHHLAKKMFPASIRYGRGLYTAEVGMLLNRIGFTEVTIVSGDIQTFDFSWKGLEKSIILGEMQFRKRYNHDKDRKDTAAAYVDFLSDAADNNLIIDYRFGDYIRKSIDHGKPVLICFSFTVFHEIEKFDAQDNPNPQNGFPENHEVVICGYDKDGAYIVDSHWEGYVGKLHKYRNGRYKMKWETLATVMGIGFGDIIIPSGYVKRDYNGMVQKS